MSYRGVSPHTHPCGDCTGGKPATTSSGEMMFLVLVLLIAIMMVTVFLGRDSYRQDCTMLAIERRATAHHIDGLMNEHCYITTDGRTVKLEKVNP